MPEQESQNKNAIFLSQPADDEGNARCAVAFLNGRFAFSDVYGWMRYTGTHWNRDDAEAAVDRALLAVLKQRRSVAVTAEKEAIVKATVGSNRRLRDCKAIFRSLVSINVDEFDMCPDLLNVANGVIDLRTGTLTPHSPDQRFTYCIRIPYDIDADYIEWVEFLGASISHPEQMLDYLQMAVGYSVTGHTSEECLWYIHGPSRSGKGTFTEALLTLLGGPLSTEVDFASFTSKRDGDTQNFDLAPLKPARFIVTSESNKYETLNTAKIKALTGGNHIRCAFKYGGHFTFRPQFKAWLVSNQPVNADVDDDALWYRVKVIEFPHAHIGNEDKTLKVRMKTPEVLAGVLRWVVEGAIAWYASKKGLTHPKPVVDTTQAHRDDLDMVQLWINECCTEGITSWTAHEDLYRSYSEWCGLNGVEPKKARGMTLSLKAKGFTNDTRYIESIKRTKTIILGLALTK